MPILDPRVVPAWLVRTLIDPTYGVDAYLTTKGIDDILIAGRVMPRHSIVRAEQMQDNTLYPWIGYGKRPGRLHTWGEEPLLSEGIWLVTAVIREDLVPDGYELDSYHALLQMAIQAALNGVRDPTVNTGGIAGTVHSCYIVEDFGPLSFDGSTEGFRTRDLGYQAQIHAS